jgi:methionine-rich copper-binding protein CopC
MPSRVGSRARRRAAVTAWAGVLVASAAIVLLPQAAEAHAALISSSPSDGDVLGGAPAEVVLTFDEDVRPPAFVSVIAPDGANVADGEAAIDGPTVTQPLRLVPEQGAYSIGYRVVSDDGHPVTGAIHFTVDPKHATSTPVPTSPTSPACTDDCGAQGFGTAFWDRESTWVVVALSALAVGIALVFAIGLRSGKAESDSGGGG